MTSELAFRYNTFRPKFCIAKIYYVKLKVETEITYAQVFLVYLWEKVA